MFEYAQSTGNTSPRILFVCPRQSGKTTALFTTFLNTPDSIFMTTVCSRVRELRAKASVLNPRGDNLRPMYDVVGLSSSNAMRGRLRRFCTVFIDDADRYLGDWDELFACLYPCMKETADIRRGVIAAMTPTRRREEFFANFDYIRRPVSEPPSLIRSDFDRDHFEDEDFTI